MSRIFGFLTGIGPAIGGLGIGAKIAIAVGLFAAGAIAITAWSESLIARGEEKAIAEIAKGDAKMIGRAQEARRRVSACWDVNREWDQTTGSCQ